MSRYDMTNYIEKNFEKILDDHMTEIKKRVRESRGDLDIIYDLVDEINFHNSWQENSGYKVSVFLKED